MRTMNQKAPSSTGHGNPTVQRCLLAIWLLAHAAACTTTSKYLLPEHLPIQAEIAAQFAIVLAYIILMAIPPLLLLKRMNPPTPRVRPNS